MLTGPESCGKTTLANQLSETLGAPLVPEASREYLQQKISRNSTFRYSEPDLLEIASLQHMFETNTLDNMSPLVICDTDLLVLIIWSEVRFGSCHSWIRDTFTQTLARHKRHYLLCDYRIPWQPDPLRESPDSRGELFELYRQKLQYYGATYTQVAGTAEERLEQATAIAREKAGRH